MMILLNYNSIERKYLPDGCPQRSFCLMHDQLVIVLFCDCLIIAY